MSRPRYNPAARGMTISEVVRPVGSRHAAVRLVIEEHRAGYRRPVAFTHGGDV